MVFSIHQSHIGAADSLSDLGAMREQLYFGPGYIVVRGFLKPQEVQHIVAFWEANGNPEVENYKAEDHFYPNCPNATVLKPHLQTHFNYFWNEPKDPYTGLIAWKLQTLRNMIEGVPISQGFLGFEPKYRVSGSHCESTSYRVVLTREQGPIAKHRDWVLDHSRLQCTLMLSNHDDYESGGFFLFPDDEKPDMVFPSKAEKMQAGDLLIFQYRRIHGVEPVKPLPGKPGFLRILLPRQSLPNQKPLTGFAATYEQVRSKLTFLPQLHKPQAHDHFEESRYVMTGEDYYGEEAKQLIEVAIRNGFSPNETYYHRGLWSRFEMFANWQMEILKEHGWQPQHQLLDIGCGFGRLAIRLLPLQEPPGIYCGIDPVDGYVDLAKHYLAALGEEGRDWQVRVGANFEFEPFQRQFDFAVAHSVFTHLSYQQIKDCMVELKKVMKAGGKFLFTFTVDSNREEQFIYITDMPMTASSHDSTRFYEDLGQQIGYTLEVLPKVHPTQTVCIAHF